MIASEERARRSGSSRSPTFAGSAVAGVDPAVMGIGPVPAVRKLLERTRTSVDEIDLVELNEAFASQSLAVIRELGLDPAKVNVNGGAIAIGHPLGMSGARLVVSLVHELAPPQRPHRPRDALHRRRPGSGRALHQGSERIAVARTQVGIVGAGPAGLLLAHLLHEQGIESVVLENRTEEYVIARVRAGVLEQGVVDVFRAAGLADRIEAEGLVHHGIELRFDGQGHRIAMSELTGGRTITIYGQNRVVEDLDRRAARGRRRAPATRSPT